MAFQQFGIEVMGEKQVSRAFEAMAHEVQDLSEPLGQIGDSLISHVHSQFATEGGAGSYGRWKPLNPAYEAWKQQQVGDQPILVFTGKMRAAMVDHGAVTVSPRKMVYDPDVPDYTEKHQTGDGVPQRRMVDLPKTVARQWERVFATWLNEQRQMRGF